MQKKNKNRYCDICKESVKENNKINFFWKFVLFIDKTHYDKTSESNEQILREKGTQYKSENTLEMLKLAGAKTHFMISVS